MTRTTTAPAAPHWTSAAMARSLERRRAPPGQRPDTPMAVLPASRTAI
ncbi:hypothetical protein ACWGA4_34025 [Streptomyces rubiginosohelvolus]|nr:hypothetical protein [Streptomyces sp. CB02130]